MKFDTKYFTGDIIASIYAGACTEEELIKRFDNHTYVFLQQLVCQKIDELINKEMLRRNKQGVLKCTLLGKRYIAERGYLT